MNRQQQINDAKTRIVLLLILTTLLHMGDFGWIAWFASVWSTLAFISLVISIHNSLKYGG